MVCHLTTNDLTYPSLSEICKAIQNVKSYVRLRCVLDLRNFPVTGSNVSLAARRRRLPPRPPRHPKGMVARGRPGFEPSILLRLTVRLYDQQPPATGL